MPSTWTLTESQIKSHTAFSTNLAVMALRIPHDQVREAPSAVPKVSSQTPAHTTENRTPKAGDKILNTKGELVTHLQDQDPKMGLSGQQSTPVQFNKHGLQEHQRQLCHSDQAPEWLAKPQISYGKELSVVSYQSLPGVDILCTSDEEGGVLAPYRGQQL